MFYQDEMIHEHDWLGNGIWGDLFMVSCCHWIIYTQNWSILQFFAVNQCNSTNCSFSNIALEWIHWTFSKVSCYVSLLVSGCWYMIFCAVFWKCFQHCIARYVCKILILKRAFHKTDYYRWVYNIMHYTTSHVALFCRGRIFKYTAIRVIGTPICTFFNRW